MSLTEIKAGSVEWLDWHRTHIGASLWPVLLLEYQDRPRWMWTPMRAWESLTGESLTGRAPEEEPSDVMQWGLRLEPAAAPWYEDEVKPPRKVERVDRLWLPDDGPDYLGCTLDGIATAEDGRQWVWECKAPGIKSKDDWKAPSPSTSRSRCRARCTARGSSKAAPA
jgi:hypothetical protein